MLFFELFPLFMAFVCLLALIGLLMADRQARQEPADDAGPRLRATEDTDG